MASVHYPAVGVDWSDISAHRVIWRIYQSFWKRIANFSAKW